MSENSKIQWTHHTASPWHGCSKVHLGCDNCYAEAMSVRNPGTLGIWGDEGTRVKSKSFATNCRKWQKSAEKRGVVERVFPSICDPFEDRPELAEWRREMFAVIDECPNLVFLLLTKRPENIRRMWRLWPKPTEPQLNAMGSEQLCDYRNARLVSKRQNVWLGTSVSNQKTANVMVPKLLECRGLSPVLFLSAEPLLEDIQFGLLEEKHEHPSGDPILAWTTYNNCLTGFRAHKQGGHTDPQFKIDLVIAGGESGPNARVCQVEWLRSIRDQCDQADVACFIKQLGANVTGNASITRPMSTKVVKAITERLDLKDKKGGDMSEWPEDLRVRKLPCQ